MRRFWLTALALVLLFTVPMQAQNSTWVTIQGSQTSGITNTTTTRNTIVFGNPGYKTVEVLLNITGAGVATGGVQVYLQDSVDGGTTWDDVISSNVFVFGAALTTQRFFVNGEIATTATQGSAVSNEALTAGTVRNGPFGDRWRVREKVANISGTPTGVTYVITAVFKQ